MILGQTVLRRVQHLAHLLQRLIPSDALALIKKKLGHFLHLAGPFDAREPKFKPGGTRLN